MSFAQSDTIVVHDYTNVMINVDNDGNAIPALLDESKQAGFFINGVPEGQIRICNSEITYIWVDGKLQDRMEPGCKFFDPEDLMSERDTAFVSFFSQEVLTSLTCDLIEFQELVVIRDDPKLPREIRDATNEFSITALIVIVLIIGLITIRNPSRVAYILEKSFTFKISSYEFINTNFISVESIQVASLLSVITSFLGIYFDQRLSMGFIPDDSSYTDFLMNWLQLSVGIFIFILVKWIFISAVARLFHFREINNYQLFDFINFCLFLCIPIFLFTSLDYILNNTHETWIPNAFEFTFPLLLSLYIGWFILKFVNNSPRRKLLIISYLCATEIIPAILIFGWFYE